MRMILENTSDDEYIVIDSCFTIPPNSKEILYLDPGGQMHIKVYREDQMNNANTD